MDLVFGDVMIHIEKTAVVFLCMAPVMLLYALPPVAQAVQGIIFILDRRVKRKNT